MSKYFDSADLVGSLVGKSSDAIYEGLVAAGTLHERVLKMTPSQRALYENTARYSQFAKGALHFLYHSGGSVPSGVESSEFRKIVPLVRNMVARGIAHPEVSHWLTRSDVS